MDETNENFKEHSILYFSSFDIITKILTNTVEDIRQLIRTQFSYKHFVVISKELPNNGKSNAISAHILQFRHKLTDRN